MAVGGISNQNYLRNYQVGPNTTQRYTQQLASGKKQNKAADGAVELAAAQILEEQQRGYQVGRNNYASARDAMNIADGGMAGQNDYLQEINEKSVQAMNGTLSDSDRRAIQDEIGQLTQGMNDIAATTRYNETNLLNNADQVNVVGDANGSSRSVNTSDTTAAGVGMQNYSVLNGQADLGAVSGAMRQVSANRSLNGAQTNALEYGMNYNSIARENTIASESRKADTDYAETITNQRTRQTLDTYRIQMQRQQMLHAQNAGMGMFNN